MAVSTSRPQDGSTEEGAGQRASVLAYPALLNIAEGYQAF